VSIVRAVNDVERIAQVEEDVLPPGKRDLLRFYSLQIARLASENSQARHRSGLLDWTYEFIT
jgi:hypothetical protein